ncbi:energy-coupling factor ABC transporter permease [Crenobacter cavernae]|uniref:Energy-coupling factor ABC transporter permease n=1 Tax=Crenobacter cavernae TaxID=2290923 RepID=A0ABY0F9V5_9NEIS|nr:energy-coupling factor ABC transporter permease [Crenobacter cavernae]RXZ42447.1 hypothetical protein EBB06_11070 [Crenobacter cavernae]
MNVPAFLFDAVLLWSALGAAVLALAGAAWRVDWKTLTPSRANAWAGAMVLTMLMWTLSGGFKPGLSFHLLGAALMTLLMGPWLALLALAAVLAGATAMGAGSWLAIGLNWWTMAAVPVGVAGGGLWLAQRLLPANLFVYVFVNAFLAGGASYFAASLSGVAVLGLAGAYEAEYLLADALPFYFLLSWSEAFTSGLLTAVLVVYRPHWVSTFDDDRYLKDPPLEG